MAKATTPVQSVRDLILFDETRYTLWDAAIENFAQQHASSNYVEIPVSDLTPQWFNEAKLLIPDEKYFHEFEINRIVFLPAWYQTHYEEYFIYMFAQTAVRWCLKEAVIFHAGRTIAIQ